MYLLRILNNLYYPEGDVGTPFGEKGDREILADDKETDTEDVADQTDDEPDDEEVDDKKVKDEEVNDVEDDTEDEEVKEDETEDDEEDTEEEDTEDDEEYKAVPQIATIKKEFPELFKKFPELRAAIFRDQKFSEFFATPEEAKIASSKSQILDNMESDLMSGKSERLLDAIKKSNNDSYVSLVKGLLPTIKSYDKDTYLKLAAVPIKEALRAAMVEGRRNDNKNLEYSAIHLNRFLFNDDDVAAKTDFESESKTKKTDTELRLEKKLQEIDERDTNNFKTTVDSSFSSRMEKEFYKGLDDTIPERTRKVMFKEVMNEVNEQLGSDTRYQNHMKSLWMNAQKNGFSTEAKAKIVNTALARAQQLLPTLRAKIRKEMGIGGVKKVAKKVYKEGKTERTVTRHRDNNQKSDLDLIREA